MRRTLCAVVAACGLMAMPAVALGDGGSGSGSADVAFGSGALSDGKTFSFSAFGGPSGGPGFGFFSFRNPNGSVAASGFVTCIRAFGNTAVVGGRATGGDLMGSNLEFTVTDNGTGLDTISSPNVSADPATCAAPDNDPNLVIGQIVVRDGTAAQQNDNDDKKHDD